ncbi:hypothetical protein O181_039109 [Austropuccinia psidii MF-1]|uniref:Reverse transcriptase RNase H-like domain-containing protein n=1 Tax=Austropuccinia psidii MF-1 TaxID=1389203 RepID=A0A9Q3D9S6_9BASI|nr:hypothetical protein [Austropuccinia psidii MF-1]
MFTTVSSRIIQRKLIYSPVSSRSIAVFPLMRKLIASFTNPKRPSPQLQSFSTYHCRETNSSNYGLGAVLSQASDFGKHPIAFDSHKPIPAELNHEIHDKEILGIFCALKCWGDFLISLSSPFEALTNNSSLQYLMSSKVLTYLQAHWAELIFKFHFSITYFTGYLATLTDSLSHQENVYPERGEDFTSKKPMNFQQLINEDEVQPSRFFEVKVKYSSNLGESIQKKLWKDSQHRKILQ